MGTDSSSFKAFLLAADLINRFDRTDLPMSLQWTAWMDPGVHTGFAMVVYATGSGQAEMSNPIAIRYSELMAKVGICGWRGEVGPPAGGVPDLCSAALLAIHTEMFTGHEPEQVRRAVGRVRQLGAVFCGHLDWDVNPDPGSVEGEGPGLGAAGIGAERFFNMRSNRDEDYLSPVRIRSMFQYALEDEFGVEMRGQVPSDALNTFTDDRMKAVGLYVPGPDHHRAALAHALLSIRKNG